MSRGVNGRFGNCANAGLAGQRDTPHLSQSWAEPLCRPSDLLGCCGVISELKTHQPGDEQSSASFAKLLSVLFPGYLLMFFCFVLFFLKSLIHG